MSRTTFPRVAVATIIALTGCAAPAPKPPAHNLAGNSRVESLSATDDRRYHLEPGDAVEQPVPIDNAPPAYPPALVALNLAPLVFDVRVVVDAGGAARDCQPLAPRDPNALPHGAEFLAAICAATAQWRFTPLRVAKAEDVDENGDGETDAVRRGVPQALPFSLDYRFRFSVTDGKAQVQLDHHGDAR